MPLRPSELPKPTTNRRISTLELLQGKGITPAARLDSMSEDEFEEITLHWAHEYLTARYEKVRQYAGAGDKGRDVVGFKSGSTIDIYQCKHYNTRISPAMIYVEFGKLCYYTYRKDYDIPQHMQKTDTYFWIYSVIRLLFYGVTSVLKSCEYRSGGSIITPYTRKLICRAILGRSLTCHHPLHQDIFIRILLA